MLRDRGMDVKSESMESRTIKAERYFGVAVISAVFLMLYVASRVNYLVFHSLAELFAVVVAFSIFVVAWNSRRFVKNDYVFFLGTAYFFVGVFDMIHMLSYKGMGVFPAEYGANLPTQAWIAGRYIESASLFLAVGFVRRELSVWAAFAGFGVLSFALLAAIFNGVFPLCFSEATGLTAFKRYSEYAICAILIGAIITIHYRRNLFAPSLRRLLIASIVLTIVSELAFTMYLNVFDFMNAGGHLFKVASFYLIYLAIIRTGIMAPYFKLDQEILHRKNLQESLLKVSDREQRNIGQELHDTAAQHWAGSLYMLETLRQDIADSLPDKVEDLDKILSISRKGMTRMRQIAHGLTPVNLSRGGLRAALEELVEGTEEYGVNCRLIWEERGNAVTVLDQQARRNIFHICQEGVTNAIKHGKPSKIEIMLDLRIGTSALRIENDGRDFDVGQAGDGMGMEIMQYRASMVHGALDVKKRIGGGTIISCKFSVGPPKDVPYGK